MHLSELITRLEKLTGPDKEIDFWLSARLFDPSHETDEALQADIDLVGIDGMVIDAPFTASLDAAVALTERLLPGWTIASIGQDDRKGWHAELREGHRTSYSTVQLAGAPSPAIALVLATLRAYAATHPAEQEKAE